jgi:oxygen-independent coproporphyrinogen III oxidase
MQPAGVYISFPFCRQKCSYCNFASDVQPASLMPRYVDALIREIRHRSEICANAALRVTENIAPNLPLNDAIDTIYMGGGTPGLLDADQLSRIVHAVRDSFDVFGDLEFTIEASPENVTPATAAAWRELGINRISMGVQSMITEELRAVGRLHTAETVAQAFDDLRCAGINNVGADLIAGLPNQTASGWERSLRGLLAVAPEHVSVYMLEVDDDSRLGRELRQHGTRYQAAAVPTDDEVAEFYVAAIETLQSAGYDHYEISNFARPGKSSRHNMKYWSDVAYFGFGADAHSYDGHYRWANADALLTYIEGIEHGRSVIVERTTLSTQDKLEERLFLGLRRREGVNLARLRDDFDHAPGRLLQQYSKHIREFSDAGLLEMQGETLRLTPRGILFSNEVFAGFLEETK